MEAEAILQSELTSIPTRDSESVCASVEESLKLLKLFEILIRIDKNLKKKNE